jgi:hypothetical protein
LNLSRCISTLPRREKITRKIFKASNATAGTAFAFDALDRFGALAIEVENGSGVVGVGHAGQHGMKGRER